MIKFTAKHVAFCLGLLLTFLFAFWQLSPQNTSVNRELKKLDGLLYDARFRLLLNQADKTKLAPELADNTNSNSHNTAINDQVSASIIIVDIDEKSIREQGRFPWGRDKIALLVERLFDAGVTVIAFDVMFSEQEINPIEKILNNVSPSDPLFQLLTPLTAQYDADLKFAESLKRGDVVLGGLFEDNKLAMSGLLPNSPVILPNGIAANNTTAIAKPAFIGVIDKLHQTVTQHGFSLNQGFMNSTPDADGSIRRAALLMRHKDKLYTSLAVEAVRAYTFEEKVKVETHSSGDFEHITAIWMNQKRIPTDINGRILVPYIGGKGSFPYVSATDVIEGRVDDYHLSGAIVFVGTSSVGLADLRETPVGIQYPGVEIHANVAKALLQPDTLVVQLDVSDQLIALFILLVGCFISWLLPKQGPVKMAIIGSSFFIATIGLNLVFWVHWHIVFPLTTSLLMVICITVLNVALGFMAESSQKKTIKTFFDQYVPPAHINKMLSDPSSVSFDGERKEMTVLFSDIRSFTSISEQLSASELKQLLNSYFSPITKDILDNKGTIDKYVGDMVMAFWGAPIDDAHHAHHAISAAFSMLATTKKLNERFAKQDMPEINVGIGINTGEMNVGDMGSEFRRAYTVLGDAVNLGSRLEGLTKFYGVDLLVSEATKIQAPDFAYKSIDKVKVKGKVKAVAIYLPIGLKNTISVTQQAELDLHEQAYRSYLNKNWQDSAEKFNLLHNQQPNCVLYSLYLNRIDQLRDQHLEDWDGSFTHTSK